MAPDAVIIGAGPNGLVAANALVDAGWSVVVLEEQPAVGGAVRSDRSVHADYIHDTFSTFYPLAAASSTIQGFRLEDHGLRWVHADAVLGHPQGDGTWAILHRDRNVTAALLEEQTPGDGEAWLALCAEWDRIGDALIGALLSPFPPLRHGLRALLTLPSVGGLDFVRTAVAPATDLVRTRFRGDAARLLLAGNAGHADIPLDGSGSGFMGLFMCMLGQTVGFPVPEGGAGALTQALASRFTSRGGEIRCHSRVDRILTTSGRAVGVQLADGERVAAGRAVVADVIASKLYGGLVPEDELPARVVRAMRGFTLDAATVKVDWALDRRVPWRQLPPHDPGTVHIADSFSQMSEALSQVAARAIPAKPFMLAGQMTTTDPTRSPEGTESFWAYTHVPQQVERDAGDGSVRGTWDRDDCERMADRMQARLEEQAPGFSDRIVARRVLGPRDMEAMNANLQGGAINGGTAQLQQQLIFRPIPGLGRAETPIRGLYLGSASAHPGGGVHGAAGMNAARAALWHHRLGAPRRLLGSGWGSGRPD